LIPSSYTQVDSPIPLVLIFPALIAALFIRPHAAMWAVAAIMTSFAIRLSLSDVPVENQTRFLLIGTENLTAFALILWIGTHIFWQALRTTITTNDALRVLNLQLQQENQQRLAAEQQLVDAQLRQLELDNQKNLLELRQQFIATLSHDFRTPLTVLRSSADMLEHYFDRLTPEQRAKPIRNIQKQIQRMVDLLDEVLTLHRSQAGKFAFNPASLAFKIFCDGLLAELQLTVSDRSQLIFGAKVADETIFVDEQLLRHILTNLLSNAIKYSPQGGTIQLVGSVQDKTIHIAVSDEGIGIAPEEMAFLFDPFRRGGNIGNIQGTGLGLYIVKTAVETHGGTITCKSTPGKGTTFTVELPIPN
jgi:signal transduction histidine kinase